LGCLAQSASPILPRRPPVLGGKAVDVRDFEAAYLVISAEADETMADKHRKTFGRGCTSMFGNAEIQTFVFRIVCYSYPSSDTSECPSMAHDAPVPADENGPRDSQLSISRGITKRRVVSRPNQGGPGVLKKKKVRILSPRSQADGSKREYVFETQRASQPAGALFPF